MEVDGFAAVIGRLTAPTRRAVLGWSIGGGLAGLSGPAVAKNRKKKRKKCKRPAVRCGKKCCVKGECQFIVKKSRWILQADCTITRGIEIPNRVTLDGNGKTIAMAGPKAGYTAGGLNAGSGQANVVNLTIHGAGLTEPCATGSQHEPSAIVFGQTSGRIENVTISDVNCTGAIAATTADAAREHTIEVVRTTVTVTPPPDRAGVGINAGGSGAGRLVARVTDCDFTAAALLFNTNVEATVDDCDIRSTFVAGLHGADVTVKNSRITDAGLGISAEDGTTLTVTGNTIAGPGVTTGFEQSGVEFRPGTSGSVTNNAISNYTDPGPGTACGIRVQAGAGPVTGSGNTFSGNEQNECPPG